jgi:hypothetical protein
MNNAQNTENADSPSVGLNDLSASPTNEEKWWLKIMRLNKVLPKDTYIDKKFKIGKVKTHIEWKSSKSLWGRFGGGWNWHLGVEWSKTTIIIFLLVMSIHISWYQRAC